MTQGPALTLGSWLRLDATGGGEGLLLPASHLTTHGVVVGQTGSGKTGLVTVLVEEALSAGIPTIVIDVKGDLPNLLLTFPQGVPEWGRRVIGDRTPNTSEGARRFADTTRLRVLTPGATFGEPLHLLSPLERRSSRWDSNPAAAEEALGAAVSLVLRLLGRDPNPGSNREHPLLTFLAGLRLRAGENADVGMLMRDLQSPPVASIGDQPIDAYVRRSERQRLAAALNSLNVSATFSRWRQGTNLDVSEWLTPRGGRTPGTIVSVAHLNDEDRQLALGMVLHELLLHVRGLRGSTELQALIVFDEVRGFVPPHPANPPTKGPIVALMQQARAFGVGVVVATQNPMDLDYRAISNAGLWWLGRLQSDADRRRMVKELGRDLGSDEAAELDRSIGRLAPRWFVTRNARASAVVPLLLRPRDTFSVMRGPLVPEELALAREGHAARSAGDPGTTASNRDAAE